MIDIENEIFTRVAKALRAKFTGIYVSGDVISTPSVFPAVFFTEMGNSTAQRYLTQAANETHADLLYEAQVFSNKISGKKAEAKAIMTEIDAVMQRSGFVRQINEPLFNLADASIARRVARWRATTDGRHIYRR